MTARRGLLVVLLVAAGCVRAVPPAMPGAPAHPEVPALALPAGLVATPDVVARHDQAWRRFQANDLRGAARDWQAALQMQTGFYPAQVGLGYIATVERRWDDARARFLAALAINPDYVPALVGQVDAALSADDLAGAAVALERLIALTPEGEEREARRSRLDVLRLRAVQDALGRASAAREAGRLDDARAALDQARQLAPGSPVVVRERARLEVVRGAFDEAEQLAREALTLDKGDPDTHAVLGEVLEAQGRLRDAAAAFAQAARLDPRPEWRDRAASLASAADMAALPAEYRALPTAAQITRAQLATLLGIRLERAIAASSRRQAVVLTDVRNHWAATWILPVTRAGLMDALPNHTFQPGAVVSRADLARVLWQTLQVLAATRTKELASWQTARLSATDVPRGHLAASAVAAVMAAGAMTADAGGRFRPSAPATGADALAAVARLEAIIGAGR